MEKNMDIFYDITIRAGDQAAKRCGAGIFPRLHTQDRTFQDDSSCPSTCRYYLSPQEVDKHDGLICL